MRIAMTGLRAIGQEGVPVDSPPGGGHFLDLFSGVEKAVEEIGVRLAAKGHEVTVFCRGRYNPTGMAQYKGIRLVNLPAMYTKHLEAFSHTFLASVRALGGFDVVHFHATGPALFSFIPRLGGTATVATVHGLDWQREKWGGAAKVVLKAGAWAAGRFPSRTIVVSRELQQFYAERYGRETVYIPNGISPVSPAPLERLRRLGLEKDGYVLFLSRLVPEKGCHLLIQAFRTLQTEARLLMVGGGSYTGAYVESLKELAKGDPRIIFSGALYGQDKAEAFSNARLMVLPSTLEGLPIVLLEAMNYGCPVLCSDIAANQGVVAPPGGAEAYGAVFSSGSSEDLARQLRLLLEEGGRLKERAQRAQRYVAEAFSWDRVAEETERVYLSLGV